MGGDGSTHSFRRRSAMLRVLEESPPTDDIPDHQYFVREMLSGSGDYKYNVADRNATLRFAGAGHSNGGAMAPLLLSGTQARLNWTAREGMLAVCPELKMIFPSLHEPACFGARPNPEKCKGSICALSDHIPSHGC